MKNLLFFILLSIAVMNSSCSQTDIPDVGMRNSDGVSATSVSTRAPSGHDSILYFDSEADFNSAVNQLSSLSSIEEKINWVRNNFNGFRSIQELYWDAMNEVDTSDDDSMESFEEFQLKFNGLFFPKYMEDMGFYIPMSDLDKAFLANRECEVAIGGTIWNLRDIYDYATLMKLGRAYYSMESPMVIGTVYNFTLSSTSMDPVGPEYDSDWRYFKDNTTDGTERKIKLKARRKFVGITGGSESRIHLELCFRKKRWCGFTNYNGKSEMIFKTVVPGWGNLGPIVFNNESYSSHDEEFRYPIKIFNDGNHWYYTFAEVPFNVTVNFNKIKDPIVFEWNMYALQCVTGPNGYPAYIIPNF